MAFIGPRAVMLCVLRPRITTVELCADIATGATQQRDECRQSTTF